MQLRKDLSHLKNFNSYQLELLKIMMGEPRNQQLMVKESIQPFFHFQEEYKYQSKIFIKNSYYSVLRNDYHIKK
jgi:hypothetical protein